MEHKTITCQEIENLIVGYAKAKFGWDYVRYLSFTWQGLQKEICQFDPIPLIHLTISIAGSNFGDISSVAQKSEAPKKIDLDVE